MRTTALAVAAAAISLGALPAPAYATTEADHCLEPPYTAQLVYHCGCLALADALAPVIPPSTWNCNL